MSKRFYICQECGHRFEAEEGKPVIEDPLDCPVCHSTDIIVFAVRIGGEELVPVGPAPDCDSPTSFT